MKLGKRGITITEAGIALFILLISIAYLNNLAVSYMLTLSSVKERYLANSLAQEGIELAIALRNKQFEHNVGRVNPTNPVEWLGIPNETDTYCLGLENGEIKTSTSPTEGCLIIITSSPVFYRKIKFEKYGSENFASSSIVKVTSEVTFRNLEPIKIETILTSGIFIPFSTSSP